MPFRYQPLVVMVISSALEKSALVLYWTIQLAPTSGWFHIMLAPLALMLKAYKSVGARQVDVSSVVVKLTVLLQWLLLRLSQ